MYSFNLKGVLKPRGNMINFVFLIPPISEKKNISYSGVHPETGVYQQQQGHTHKDKLFTPTPSSLRGASSTKTISDVFLLSDWLWWPLNRFGREEQEMTGLNMQGVAPRSDSLNYGVSSSAPPPLGDADRPVTPWPVTAVWNLTGVSGLKSSRADRSPPGPGVLFIALSSDKPHVKCTVFD